MIARHPFLHRRREGVATVSTKSRWAGLRVLTGPILITARSEPRPPRLGYCHDRRGLPLTPAGGTFLAVLRLSFLGYLVSGLVAHAQIADSSLVTGNPFAPFLLRLHENPEMSPLPSWMPGAAVIHPDWDSVEIPLPALATQPQAERFALTVVFEDGGDGGPAVEWRRRDGSTATLSGGLGEALDDVPLGLNARTVLLPRNLTEAGGTLIVSYFDRFSALASLALQPAREGMVAVVGPHGEPALLDKSMRVFSDDETSGRRLPPLTGDVRHGTVTEAELAAGIEPLEGEIEFVVPVEGEIDGVILTTEALGLDPEARVEIVLNGHELGALGMEVFALDDPTVTEDAQGRLFLAGWRKGSLFLPARLWQSGENSLVLRLVRSTAEESEKAVFLRNTVLNLRFGQEATALTETGDEESPLPREWEVQEIDFRQSPITLEPPPEPSLPVVVTTLDRAMGGDRGAK